MPPAIEDGTYSDGGEDADLPPSVGRSPAPGAPGGTPGGAASGGAPPVSYDLLQPEKKVRRAAALQLLRAAAAAAGHRPVCWLGAGCKQRARTVARRPAANVLGHTPTGTLTTQDFHTLYTHNHTQLPIKRRRKKKLDGPTVAHFMRLQQGRGAARKWVRKW